MGISPIFETKKSAWPIWLLIDPLWKTIKTSIYHLWVSPHQLNPRVFIIGVRPKMYFSSFWIILVCFHLLDVRFEMQYPIVVNIFIALYKEWYIIDFRIKQTSFYIRVSIYCQLSMFPNSKYHLLMKTTRDVYYLAGVSIRGRGLHPLNWRMSRDKQRHPWDIFSCPDPEKFSPVFTSKIEISHPFHDCSHPFG